MTVIGMPVMDPPRYPRTVKFIRDMAATVFVLVSLVCVGLMAFVAGFLVGLVR